MKLLWWRFLLTVGLFHSTWSSYYSYANDFDQEENGEKNFFVSVLDYDPEEELGPEITSLTPLSSCSLEVVWDADAFGENTTYVVNWVQQEGTSEPNESGELEDFTSEYNITDLNSETAYVVWVTANMEGDTLEGNNITETTYETSAVANLATTRVTSTRIDLEWAMEKGDCPLSFFLVGDGEVLWDPGRRTNQKDTTDELRYSMLNLIPYTNYNITVQGSDAAGTTGGSQTIQQQTPEGEAEAPEDITPEVLSPSSVNLTWSEPAAKNGILSGYIVKGILMPEKITIDSKETEANETFALMENLVACGDYVFTVQAQTSNGSVSGDLGSVMTQTQAEVPPPVTKLIVESVYSTSVNLTWTAPDTLCPITNYSLQGSGEILWKTENDTVDRSIPGEVTVYLVENLIPMTNYSLQLLATTEAGDGDSVGIIFETLEDVPSEPQNLNSSAQSPSEVKLEWDPPKDLNGVLLNYLVTWQSNVSSPVSQDTEEESYLIGNLDPCQVYDIKVQGVNDPGPGEPAMAEVQLPAEVPPAPTNMGCEVKGSREIEVTWGKPNTTCQIVRYDLVATGTVIWSKNETLSSKYTTSLHYTLNDLVPYTDYIIKLNATTGAGPGDVTSCTVTTSEEVPGPPKDLKVDEDSVSSHSFEISWMAPDELNGLMNDFLIRWGTQKAHVSYRDDSSFVYRLEIEADSSQNYNVTVQGENGAGTGTPAFTPVRTGGSSLGLVLGLVIPIILIAVLVGLGYTHREDLKKRMNNIRRAYPTSDNDNISELSTAPIPLDQLKTHLHKLQSGNSLHGEYNSIAAASYKGSTREAEKAENQSKNRYANILPYDETIVKLRSGPSTYINANYIDSFNRPKFFIATQGPKDNTLEDFWDLVWQENVDIVVMLASCIEGGKSKSAQYWPVPLAYGTDLGEYTIHNINEEASQLFSLRMLEVTKRKESTKRLVKQYHYAAWPDFGAPEKDDEILKLLFFVRKNIKTNREQNKMIVHCSAGVGRTGTFIALWNLIEEIESGSGAISIVREVLNLRRQRVMMVQSQDQYLYIFKSMVAFCENRQRWQIKSDQTSSDISNSSPSEGLYGDGSAAMYDNKGFETSFEFEGNLI